MDTRKKVLLGVGLLAAVFLLGKGNRVSPLNQADPSWANKPVGNGGRSYSAIGCVVTAITAAVNALRGTSFRPSDLMPGGRAGLTSADYTGGSVKSDQAFARLGCVVTGRIDNARRSMGIPTMCQIIDTALAAGQLALLRVDYDLTTSETNHTVVCYAKSGSSYTCMDPAGGKVIQIPASSLSVQRSPTKVYEVTGIQTVRK